MSRDTLQMLNMLSPLIGFGFFLLLFPVREEFLDYLVRRRQRQKYKKRQQEYEIMRRGGEERIKELRGSMFLAESQEGAVSIADDNHGALSEVEKGN